MNFWTIFINNKKVRESSIKYRPEVDGLRAVAVLLVLAGHFFPKHFPGAFIGVDIFFVISGFLISSIIFKEIEEGSFTIKHFYARRINRIFPSLIVVFFFCLVFGFLALYANEFKNIGKQIAAGGCIRQLWHQWHPEGSTMEDHKNIQLEQKIL